MRRESITRTKAQEQVIVDFILSHGFRNISDFSKNVNMERQNVWARIKGKTDPEIRLLLKWSSVLKCDITDLIALFYPEEYTEYKNQVCVSNPINR